MILLKSIVRHAIVLAAGAAGVAGAAHGQRPNPELAKLRTDHEKTLASASRLVDDIHRLTLRQLERERAEAGDYETAARVKERLDLLDHSPGTTAIMPPPLTHTLVAARVLTRDGASREAGRDCVEFRRIGAKALWDIVGLEKGTYEVVLTYAVGLPRFDESSLGDGARGSREPPGGTITFTEVTGLASGAAPALEKRVFTTGAWENYIRESIGRYEFRNATTTVRLEAASTTGGGLMRLRTVELIKVVGDPGPADAVVAGSEPARLLEDLRARHRERLRGIADSLRPRFAGEFLKLEQSFAASGDTASASAVARLRERLFPAAPAAGTGDDTATDIIPGLGEESDPQNP